MRPQILSIYLLALLSSSLYSKTIHIPAEHSTIQEGLDSAGAGDTVLVSPGTYFENLLWPNTQSIKLVSESGADLTIIDGNHIEPVVMIDAPLDSTTLINGFTIQNGVADELTGGGIRSWNASPKIIGNIISDNSSDLIPGGGASFLRTTRVYIIDNLFLNNSAGGSSFGGGGGGLYIYFLNPPEEVLITGNTFEGNTCIDPTYDVGKGGGMVLAGGVLGETIEISNNEFIDNSAEIGGGFWLGMPNCYFTNCSIVGNYASMLGGGAFIAAPDTYMYSCVVSANTAISGGAGVAVYLDGELNMDSCSVTDNTGEGFWFYYSHSRIHYNNIFGNSGYGVTAENCSVDARMNWWGDPSGPGGAGPGSGEEVSKCVLYDPWLTQMGVGDLEIGDELDIVISPNPFHAHMTIAFHQRANQANVQIYDLAGRIIYEHPKIESEEGNILIDIDCSHWSTGVYFVRVCSGDSIDGERCILIR